MVTNKISLVTIVLLLFSSVSYTQNKQGMSQESIDQAYSLSFEYENAQNYAKSIDALNPVYKAYENTYTVNYRLGWLYYCKGNFADAMRCLRKALAICPASIEVSNCIALVYKAQMDWKKLEEESLKVLKIDSYNLTAAYNYVTALKAQKKYDIAEGVCRRMLAVYPISPTYLFELGVVLYSTGKYSEALAAFVSTRTLYPNTPGIQEYIELLANKK